MSGGVGKDFFVVGLGIIAYGSLDTYLFKWPFRLGIYKPK